MTANHMRSFAARLLAAAVALLGAGAPPAATQGQELGGPTVVPAVDLGGLDTRSAALVFSGMEAGDLPVELAAAVLPGAAEDGGRTLLVVVQTSGEPLLAASGDDGELIGELYAYALGEDGRLHDSRTRAFRLDLDTHRQALRARGLILLTDLRVPPGDYSVRVLLLHRRSGRLGLRVLPHSVPAAGSPGAEGVDTIGTDAPLLAEPGNGRLVVAAVSPALEASLLTGTILPSAASGVPTGSTPWIWIPGAEQTGDVDAIVRGGEGSDLAAFSLADRGALAVPAGVALAAQVGPLELPAGEYRLRLHSTRGDSRERTFTLVSRESAVEGIADDRADALSTISPSVELRQTLAAYRAALEPVAGDGRAWGLDAVAALETRITGGREAERLQAAEVQAALALARRSPEALVPLLHLHGQLYPTYFAAERYDAAQHAGAMVRRLSRLYDERSHSPERHRIAAAALASLGGYRQQAGAELEARSAYLAALELDEEQTAALLGAACVHESFGDYQTAVALLRRARRSQPKNAEVRLRLAINELREGADKRGRASLRELAAGPAPAWISILAYQELARALIDEEQDLADAAALLAEATEKHPENPRLAIQRLAVLDRLGRSTDAREVLARIESDTADRDSPRFRYSSPPRSSLEAARRFVATAAGERREEALRIVQALLKDVGQ